MKQEDPVIGIMYRPAALVYIAGFLGLMVSFPLGLGLMVAGIIWDETHWRSRP